MAQPHVDVVRNEWLAGFQHVVARVRMTEAGALEVDAKDDNWKEIVLRPAGGLDASTDPMRFLEHLREALHGSYLFATEVHSDDDCPYSNDLVAPIQWRAERQHA